MPTVVMLDVFLSFYQSTVARSLPQSRVLQTEGDRIYILSLQGFLFFGTATQLLDRIQQRLHNLSLLPLQFVVLNFQAVHGIDSSAVLSFVKLKQQLQPQNIKLQQENSAVATAFQSAVIQVLSDRLTDAYKEIADLLQS